MMALATLACLAAVLLTVSFAPAPIALLAARGLAVLTYLLLGLVIGREILRTFRRE